MVHRGIWPPDNAMGVDEHGCPVIRDVSAKTGGGILGAPEGALVAARGVRPFRVTADYPLDPEYVAEKQRRDGLRDAVQFAQCYLHGSPA